MTLCSALAVAAVVAVPGVRADEYTKLTYLTFSGPVQVPGVTLPAGTYMFKLADPAGGRRAIQIWDEEGTKLFTTLLTIPDEQPEAKADPVVLFSERPSGSPQAVKSWFYPAERIGYEFIYPKSQAMKIAAASNTSVLAYNDDHKDDADENTLRGAQVGRVDGQGQASADTASAASATTTTTTARADASAAAAPQADPAPRAQTAPASPSTTTTTSANRTAPTAPAAAADPAASAAPAPTTAPSTTASARTTTAPATTASTRSTAAAERTVGTSGSQDATAARSELPRTASPLAAMQLMSLALIAGGLGARQLRRRYARSQ